MKWLLRILGLLGLVIVVLLVVAFLLPAHTTATRTITLKQSPDAIFAVLADVQKMPEWNRHMEKVEILEPIDGKEATKQTFKDGMTMTIVTEQSLPPNHLIRATRDVKGGSFIGVWTYKISPAPEGSDVALTEDAEFRNPLFRLMVRFFGPTKYMDEHLVDLGKRFGETVAPR
jgi:polyketide cyclase/dehydrase/lipid transport protein